MSNHLQHQYNAIMSPMSPCQLHMSPMKLCPHKQLNSSAEKTCPTFSEDTQEITGEGEDGWGIGVMKGSPANTQHTPT
ncbi:hypothetical protein BaRGS_00039339 [Batillaria attramentaria]|uniref:Uncharacterized protein n=1 Tax=Batillaria attramentaria TaxID=370345 RepID=A0ABD0J415_9CAEN